MHKLVGSIFISENALLERTQVNVGCHTGACYTPGIPTFSTWIVLAAYLPIFIAYLSNVCIGKIT